MDSTVLTTKEAIKKLVDKVSAVKIPDNLGIKLQELFSQLEINSQNEETFWQNYYNASKYIDWIIAIPWFNETKDILDLRFAKEKLDQEHYGLETIKERILEYISVLSLQKNRNPNETIQAPIILFVGLVGTGKTTMAKSIANVMGRELVRIPFGGLGDAHYLRGYSRTRPDSEPGQIIKGLVNCKSRNPVILLDEIDRVADDALNTIMGVLVELLDPEQNGHFVDHYLDYPVDLSQVIFCATCNNTSRIATAVMDRLEIIQMPSYTDEEKEVIAKNYLLPKALKSTGLTSDDLKIGDNLWPQIVRPLGFDAGVRTLQRNIEGMCRKVAKVILEGKSRQVIVDESNVKTFLPQW
ncbi:MAG: AAA family ATPase [Candidatus Shapirobacteria bacterium]|nr:AAA family ATPase [Candidatus Shapirobacteria bacterium]MDD4410748.1 AAA family ATPase [Candidatus Shapirobacteria bacterium]